MKNGKDLNLKKIREDKGLTRKELSAMSGVNFRSLQDYEQGHKEINSAKAETLYQISQVLECSMEELIQKKTDPGKIIKRLTKYHELFLRLKEDRKYYLMHRDDVAALLVIDEITGNIITVEEIFDEKLLPLGGNRSDLDLKKWWHRRAVPIHQGNMQMLLKANDIPSVQSYLVRNLGLSLTDHYWLNPVERLFCWDEVNLFVNDFKDEFGDYRFKDNLSSENIMINMRRRVSFYPSASLQGELQKKWILQNGKRYLIKGNAGNTSQQSINEVIASLLHERQGLIPYTKYKLCDIEVSGEPSIGCFCEDFCTEEIEFIPAYEVIESEKKSNELSNYEHFIRICEKHGLKNEKVRRFLEYQILSDFVLTNVDRHLYNFGVLRDTKTLQFIDMAPIFDSGNSMFVNRKNIPKGNELLHVPVNSFKKSEVQLLKLVQDTSILDTKRLPGSQEIRELLLLDPMCFYRVDDIIGGYQRKIELLKRLQNGEKIYQYKYPL